MAKDSIGSPTKIIFRNSFGPPGEYILVDYAYNNDLSPSCIPS